MRRILLIAWAADTAALVWLFGYILLYGNNPDRAALAGDLGAIWGGLAALLGVMYVQARWRKKKEQS